MDHLTPEKAYEILQGDANTLLVDCRTEVEFYYVGHPVGSINIEWNTAPDFDVNPHFSEEVMRMAGRKDRPIIIICRSGKRSVDAGNELEKHGFTHVSNVLDGFEGELDADHHRGTIGGWRQKGLPWRQV
ncbi:MAG: rhodanese-like domain-containing protein [Burkholderiales bacterium]|nr:rhodanese-like domain-containing protein [Burkholderiales bacterium]MDE2398578.1 rhodanese-like domain-containing protein [Burkholderiales bacterium]MDE2454603.1 rhodanese-like domain-containing protein [Burkholderiales bacterium]